jgi:hypothetical protein
MPTPAVSGSSGTSNGCQVPLVWSNMAPSTGCEAPSPKAITTNRPAATPATRHPGRIGAAGMVSQVSVAGR